MVAALSLHVLLLMIGISSLYLLGVDLHVSEILKTESQGEAIKSVAPGVPSIGTVLAFLMVAIYGLGMVLDQNRRNLKRAVAVITMALGVAALAGYIADIEQLYYYVPKRSTAMAAHTAALFTILGFALYKREMVEAE